MTRLLWTRNGGNPAGTSDWTVISASAIQARALSVRARWLSQLHPEMIEDFLAAHYIRSHLAERFATGMFAQTGASFLGP